MEKTQSRQNHIDQDLCPSCGGKTAYRSKRKFPVLLQITFGGSFVVFLLFHEKLISIPIALWAWCAIQTVLGLLLVRARRQAIEKILICIRCNTPVPS